MEPLQGKVVQTKVGRTLGGAPRPSPGKEQPPAHCLMGQYGNPMGKKSQESD